MLKAIIIPKVHRATFMKKILYTGVNGFLGFPIKRRTYKLFSQEHPGRLGITLMYFFVPFWISYELIKCIWLILFSLQVKRQNFMEIVAFDLQNYAFVTYSFIQREWSFLCLFLLVPLMFINTRKIAEITKQLV